MDKMTERKMRAALDIRRENERSNDLLGLAHEIWATAQLLPGEGIEDGVERIVDMLKRSAAMKAPFTRARLWTTTGAFVLGTFLCLAVGIVSKETAVAGVVYPVMLAVALTTQRW